MGESTIAQEPVYHQYYLAERVFREQGEGLVRAAVRDERYNLIMNRIDGSYELYQWRKDYFEEKNLVDDPEHQIAFNRLRRLLATFIYRSKNKFNAVTK